MATVVDITGYAEDAMNLKDMLDGVLARVQNVYQSYNVPLPERQYWMVGQPALDCEQVVVSFMQMYLGSPGEEASQPQRCNVPRSATIAISISRSVPIVSTNGRPPTADKIQQGSHLAAIDSWVLMQAIREFDMWDDTGYGLGVIATLDVAPPEGGLQTVVLNITMAVP